jgi:hypothetical protein
MQSRSEVTGVSFGLTISFKKHRRYIVLNLGIRNGMKELYNSFLEIFPQMTIDRIINCPVCTP